MNIDNSVCTVILNLNNEKKQIRLWNTRLTVMLLLWMKNQQTCQQPLMYLLEKVQTSLLVLIGRCMKKEEYGSRFMTNTLRLIYFSLLYLKSCCCIMLLHSVIFDFYTLRMQTVGPTTSSAKENWLLTYPDLLCACRRSCWEGTEM